MNILLVLNPHAAAGRAGRLTPLIEAALAPLGRVELFRTTGPGQARDHVAARDLSEFDTTIAAGGDGTLFEVLNGLYANETPRRPTLGVLPIGTGNAFARDLGLLPGEWQKGIELITASTTRRFDAGRVDGPAGVFHFLNIVGAGLPVDVMAFAKRLKFFGRSAYSMATLWKAMQMRCYPLSITMDGQRIERESLFIEVANTRYTGTSFLVAPDAEPDDGLLDIVLVSRLSRARVLRLFPSIYSGGHVAYDEVETFRAREIRIESDRTLGLAPDGEAEGCTPVTISCLHRDIEIFCGTV